MKRLIAAAADDDDYDDAAAVLAVYVVVVVVDVDDGTAYVDKARVAVAAGVGVDAGAVAVAEIGQKRLVHSHVPMRAERKHGHHDLFLFLAHPHDQQRT